MAARAAFLLVACGAAAAALALLAGSEYAPYGALLVLLVRLLLDERRVRQVLAALRSGALQALPRNAGVPWGELSQHIAAMVTARDEKLQRTQGRLQEFLVALENSPNGVVLVDEKGHVEWSNRTAARHFGFDPHAAALQPIGSLIADPSFGTHLASWNYSRDVVLAVPVSGSSPLRLSVQVHPYAGNRRLVLSRDVTAVEQAEAMRREFVANVSHEIRTPLTVLSGFIETLQTLPLDKAERARYLQLMAQQARRMQALVSDLLTLSKLEGSPPPGPGDWSSVDELLAQCVQEASLLAATIGKDLDLRAVDGVRQEIAGSREELLSAFSNLVTNAVRYTADGGSVGIGWRQEPTGEGVFSVTDSGPGIATEHLSHLTERFYRVERSRSRETGGTGLGLAIVKHVAQRHGAELKIASTPGVGSAFSIHLPAARVRTIDGK